MDIAVSVKWGSSANRIEWHDTELNDVSPILLRTNINFDVLIDISVSQTDISANCWSIVCTVDPGILGIFQL